MAKAAVDNAPLEKVKKPIYLGGVSKKTILYFTKNLAILLKTGSTLADSLPVLDINKKDRFSSILQGIIQEVNRGTKFSDALMSHPKVFPELYVNIVRIGEESGTLEKNLEYLADQLDKNYKLKRQVRGAMAYPVLILGATVVLGGALAIFILPKISQLFKSFQVKLPITTRILIALSDFIQAHGILAAIIIFGGGALLYFLSRLKAIKPFTHQLILVLPIAGTISRHFNLSMFYRSLSILLKSGVTIDEALRVCSRTTTNNRYQRLLLEIYDRVKSGENLYDILQQNSKLIPSTDAQIINVGEASGTLADSLAYIASVHEDELNDITKNLSSLLEPIMFIFLGVVVAVMALSIIAPIYSITQQFQ